MGRGSLWAGGACGVAALAIGAWVWQRTPAQQEGGLLLDGRSRAGSISAVAAVARVVIEPPLPAVALDRTTAAGRVILAQVGAVREQPESPQAWYRLGLAYQASNDMLLARQCMEQAAEIDADAPRPRYHLALIADHAGEIERAMEAMEAALARAPRYAPGFVRLGEWHLERDDLDAAQASFERALELEPHSVRALAGVARVALGREDPEGAERVLAPAVRRGVSDPALHRAYGAALQRLGRDAEAEASLLVARRPERPLADPWLAEMDEFRVDVRTRMEQAEQLVRAGRAAQAVPLLLELRREQPENVGVVANLAVAYREAGDAPRAVALLERELRRTPGAWQLHYNLALLRYHRLPKQEPGERRTPEELAAIIPHVDAALRLNAAHAPSWALRGDLHAACGDHGAAAEAFRQAAISDPMNVEWLLRQGDAELAAGNREVAIATYRRAATLFPSAPAAARRLAEATAIRPRSGAEPPLRDAALLIQSELVASEPGPAGAAR
ncbi:MAG TPA: tetratricopeptide repeat protein [Phycisphaerales bacterium]|nr:tetratricopeptide repeat protein [Phycisphaerales bacterium]HMP37112.1 tetratricopeptide repeat protein [Phycisphaerales bacterium]